ncbi:MAG: hypothetical protein M1815_005976 [Lichina confinis]|nr:MAG: hypothetical protein M1815_005976 [Lichina confinis]
MELDFPLTTLEGLADEVPLPTFRGDDDNGQAWGLEAEPFPYHFLAQVTLRQVVARVFSNLYESGAESGASQAKGTYYEPSRTLVHELSRQLEEWRSLLPNQLQWTDDMNEEKPNASGQYSADPPLFVTDTADRSSARPVRNADTLIAALRSRYLYVRFMIYLPYIYKVLSSPQLAKDEDIENCIICLRSGIRWPITMSPPKDTMRLTPHLFGWTYSLLNVLVILHMTTKSSILRYAREKHFPPGEMESSAALMLDWIHDMSKIDAVARRAWIILKQVYPV